MRKVLVKVMCLSLVLGATQLDAKVVAVKGPLWGWHVNIKDVVVDTLSQNQTDTILLDTFQNSASNPGLALGIDFTKSISRTTTQPQLIDEELDVFTKKGYENSIRLGHIDSASQVLSWCFYCSPRLGYMFQDNPRPYDVQSIKTSYCDVTADQKNKTINVHLHIP